MSATTPPTEHVEACPECGGQLVSEQQRAETACADCGLVVESESIDHGPEWRCLDDSQSQRAGTIVDRTRDDDGFMTRIGYTDGAMSDYEGRLRRAQNIHSYGKSKKDRELARCLSDIKTLCAQIEAPQGVSDFACVLFKRFARSGDHQGIGYDPFIAAAIIAAGRIQNNPIDRAGVCERLSVDENLVFNRLQRFADAVDVGVPLRPAESYVAPWVEALGGCFETQRRAEEIANEAEAAGVTDSGAKPSGFAAAAVYAAFCGSETDPHQSQKRVAEVATASEPVIRRNCDILLEEGIITGGERR